jgi:tryptophan 2,3-dioxygenase
MLLRSLNDWIRQPKPGSFPYQDVLDEYHRVGKHFVSADLLEVLDRARSAVLSSCPASANAKLLLAFLDAALDKHDQRYEYLSYTALRLLGLVDFVTGQPKPADEASADRLLTLLVCDALDFELAAPGAFLPRMLPPAETIAKRCRLGLRLLAPALKRAGLRLPSGDNPVESAGVGTTMVRTTMSAAEASAVRLSMLPVDTVHDEYLFIRILQSFETRFCAMCHYLRQVISDLEAGTATPVAAGLDSCRRILLEAAPLFSLLATMQVAAFRQFRIVTEGASAIQSVGYKAMESLCRPPDPGRLDSIAYRSVPGVRDAVLDGQPSVEGCYRAAVAAGRLDADEAAAVAAAMGRLGASYQRWRQTHFRLAARMLGDAQGTGYTEGVPYLKAVLATPLFSVAADPGQVALWTATTRLARAGLTRRTAF